MPIKLLPYPFRGTLKAFPLKRNLKKSINLTGKDIDASGAFSSYFIYNATQGIKVLYSDGHKTIQKLRKSQVWRRATKENKLLRKCKERYRNIPSSFGVFPIRVGNFYYPGILMQHIYGETLEEAFLDPNIKYDVIKSIDTALRKKGIFHDDLHAGNIILEKNKQYWILDFTEDLVYLDNGLGER